MEHCELILDRAFKRRVIFTEMSVQIRFKILWSAIDLFQPGNPVFVRGHGCLSRNAVISVGPRNYWWESLGHGDWFRKFERYMNSSISNTLHLTLYRSSHRVQIVSSSVKVKSLGFVSLTDIIVKGNQYSSATLNALAILCCDIILGLDFKSQHWCAIFELDGNSPDPVISLDETCAVAAAATQESNSWCETCCH